MILAGSIGSKERESFDPAEGLALVQKLLPYFGLKSRSKTARKTEVILGQVLRDSISSLLPFGLSSGTIRYIKLILEAALPKPPQWEKSVDLAELLVGSALG